MEVFFISNYTDAMKIAYSLKETNSKISTSIKNEFKNTGFTVPQISIIELLYKYKKLKVSDISEKMFLTNATVSGIIDRLEGQGIVERIRSNKDRRVVYIVLSHKGENITTNLRGIIDAYFNRLFSNCTSEQLETVISGLSTLKNLVNKNL